MNISGSRFDGYWLSEDGNQEIYINVVEGKLICIMKDNSVETYEIKAETLYGDENKNSDRVVLIRCNDNE